MDHRETSKLAFFFTRKCGKVIGVLKGIRSHPRKFGSSADKGTVNDIVFYQYANSDIHLIAQCDMKEYFPALMQDIKKLNAAEYACELLNKVMPLEEPNPAVYAFLLEFLRALDTAPLTGFPSGETAAGNISRLVHMFQIKVLVLSGFRPHLDSCVRCGKAIAAMHPLNRHSRTADTARFSVLKGGLICPVCHPRDSDSIAVSPGAVATLLYIEKKDWAACLNLRVPSGIRKELKNILNNFLVFHLEKNIRSGKYL
jgi:DNA repair protein RecO (recombination protein O)